MRLLHLLVTKLHNYGVVVGKILIVHVALVALSPDANIRLRIVDVENLIYNLTLLHTILDIACSVVGIILIAYNP